MADIKGEEQELKRSKTTFRITLSPILRRLKHNKEESKNEHEFFPNLQYGIASIQGQRKTQEDSHKVAPSIPHSSPFEPEEVPFSFFGVFDGHGGSSAADFVSEHLYKIFCERAKRNKNYLEVIGDSIAQIEDDFIAKALAENLLDGTTAAVAIIQGTEIHTANVGDSEIILCRNGKKIVLSEVHNPKKNKEEIARVQKEGGKLLGNRLLHPKSVGGKAHTIAVSRAIGDIFWKSHKFTLGTYTGLICRPHLNHVTLTDKDDFLILACDGVWDVLPHQKVCDYVSKHLKECNDPQVVSEKLVQKAYNKGSTDNITACIVTFKDWKKKE